MLDTRTAVWKTTRKRIRTNKFSEPHVTSWKAYYEVDREPIGRGYAGKVYKIRKLDTSNCNGDLCWGINQFNTNAVNRENAVFDSSTPYACKAIRRWRGGKDTLSKIKREITALCQLQRSLLFSTRNVNLTCFDPDEPDNISNGTPKTKLPMPPPSASPQLLAIHEDPMEVAIVMEYAHGGSLYALCHKFYPTCPSPYNSWNLHRPTHPQVPFSTFQPTQLTTLQTSDPCTQAVTNPTQTSPRNGLPEQYVIHVIQKVLDALNYMHKQLRLVHLDIKAENILLRQPYPSTDVFITDFGLATILIEGKQHRELAGTPDYVAPEIINYDPIGFSTDMWSVGILTYFLLTGVSPFLASEKEITMQRITHGPIEFPDDLFSDRSPEAVAFLRRLIVRTPSQRMTAEQCLAHEWLRSSDNVQEGSQLTQFTDFNASSDSQHPQPNPRNSTDAISEEASVSSITSISESENSEPVAISEPPALVDRIDNGIITDLNRFVRGKGHPVLQLRVDAELLRFIPIETDTILMYFQNISPSLSPIIQPDFDQNILTRTAIVRSTSVPHDRCISVHCRHISDPAEVPHRRYAEKSRIITELTVNIFPSRPVKPSEKLEHSVTSFVYLNVPDIERITKADGESWKVCTSQYGFNRLAFTYLSVTNGSPSSTYARLSMHEPHTSYAPLLRQQVSNYSALSFLTSSQNLSEARTCSKNEVYCIQKLKDPSLDRALSEISQQEQSKRNLFLRMCHHFLTILESLLSVEYVTSIWPSIRSRQ